jgi:hypothetical protein
MRKKCHEKFRLFKRRRKYTDLKAVLKNTHWFNADMDKDPAFYLNMYPDQWSKTNKNPCGSGSASDFKVTKS